jgi:hypothetical protein
MRIGALLATLALAACAAPSGGGHGPQTLTRLTAADPATALIAGEHLDMIIETPAAGAEQAGQDALILMTLRHADGRSMAFSENNHAPMHVMAQTPGGPLAQIMGLMGEEAPKLYGARSEENGGAPFICGPQGPVSIGVYEAADGGVQVVGLKQEIEFEDLADGSHAALPYSPDMVCARLRFRRS